MDKQATAVDRRRLLALFRPYKRRLGAVLFLIGVSAALGMVSPFLLRAVLDDAIPQQDTQLLAALVAGMIAIAIATGVLGVGQTLLSNTVGQRVMHDLRAAVYRHLQRLSLAFFTRTRTGEVQSRIANDIGGVQSVVTSTATSIVSNVTTVLAATVAMFLLDWRLAVAALGLLPFFVWLTRRVGEERRRITAVRQDRLADMSSLVEESLEAVGLTRFIDHYPWQLSGGMQQRVAIARALATGNPIVLADEPTGELDFHTGAQILELLHAQTHTSSRAVLVVTHNREIARAADRVVELSSGRIVADGPPPGGRAEISELHW